MKLFSFLRRKASSPSSPIPAPVSSDPSLQSITLRTLLIVYNPTVDPATGKKLLEFMHWNKVEDLIYGYISDIQQASGGLVQHQIIERIDVDAFPAKVDGYVYDVRTFLNVLRGVSHPYMPQEVDYYAIIRQFNILQRVANNEIDEVWTFNFPHAGFYESIMGGPGAFWCNAPPLQHTEASKRRFVIMGFSFERGVGEMLEDMGHRAESIMAKVFERTHGDDNLWKRFIRYDKTHPGKAACGNVHFAPNSIRDYDWGNPSVVTSECDDWLYNFPNFQGLTRKVTARDWGSGDIRKHHVWWLSHFPKISGEQNGISYNWWQYIADPNRVNV
jgi:hypothetical protein